jgi:hypothetical protein
MINTNSKVELVNRIRTLVEVTPEIETLVASLDEYNLSRIVNVCTHTSSTTRANYRAHLIDAGRAGYQSSVMDDMIALLDEICLGLNDLGYQN